MPRPSKLLAQIDAQQAKFSEPAKYFVVGSLRSGSIVESITSLVDDMSSTEVPNGIVYFHYHASPYARRVAWYLALRGIPHAQRVG